MKTAVIIDACRTPIGRAHPEKGAFRDVRSDDLAALTENAPELACGECHLVSVPDDCGYCLVGLKAVMSRRQHRIEIAGVPSSGSSASALGRPPEQGLRLQQSW